MDVKASARYIRMSPRKVRLVIERIRGKRVASALEQLQFVNKAAAAPVLKLLQSAVANAEHNFQLKPEALYVKSIVADGGPVLHRWRARAFGRAAPIRKRSAHISVVLSDTPVVKKIKGKKKYGS
jgi:large subunit ribosomal protein L22